MKIRKFFEDKLGITEKKVRKKVRNYYKEKMQRCCIKAFGKPFGIPERKKERYCKICKKKTIFTRLNFYPPSLDPSPSTSREGSPIPIYCCNSCEIVIADIKSNEMFYKEWSRR
jgi:hypothetical protein